MPQIVQTSYMDVPLCRPHPRNSGPRSVLILMAMTLDAPKKEQAVKAVKAKITAPRPSIEEYEALLAGCHVTDWGAGAS